MGSGNGNQFGGEKQRWSGGGHCGLGEGGRLGYIHVREPRTADEQVN